MHLSLPIVFIVLLFGLPLCYAKEAVYPENNDNRYASDSLTLKKFLEQVREQNFRIQEARSVSEGKAESIRQATAWEDPVVGVNFKRNNTLTFSRSTETEYMFAQKIPLWGRTALRGDVAKAETVMAQAEALGLMRMIEIEATEFFTIYINCASKDRLLWRMWRFWLRVWC